MATQISTTHTTDEAAEKVGEIAVTEAELRELIGSIPALVGRDWRIAPLPGGLTNQNFLLESADARLVLRRNAPTVPGVDREREMKVMQQAAMRGLAPLMIACDPTAGYLVTEYVEDRRWSADDVHDPERLTALGKYLRNLHELPIDGVTELDIPAEIERYWQLDRVSSLDCFERVRGGANNLLNELHSEGWFAQRPALCHHDLTHGNIFGDYALTLIDWEFAAPGNPALDLGMFISYHELTMDEAAPLVEAYFGAFSPDVLQRLSRAVRLAQLLELLWLASRQQLPPAAEQRLQQLILVWS